MASLAGKVAIITGASRGIGRAIALKLGGDGASIVVNYAGNAGKAQEVVAEIEKLGVGAIAIQADISKVPDIQRLFEQTLERFGKVDILVNNAGIAFYKPITCQQAAQHMSEGGRIINFSSSTTVMMLPTYSAYVATKGAVEQITRVLAKELGTKAIAVNVISPGPTDTELFREGETQEQIDRLAQMAAFGKLGDVQEIADVVAFHFS
ncbi:MAG: SDR family oxidoreductase [Nostoc sp.]|uniref:SDR family oxidoreductase n=1 Tax=Nostoc sp. TaxID=1180 RepID=UPI002FF0B11E